MGELFGLLVRFSVKPGAGAAFDELTAETVEQIRTREPGTLLYAVHRVPDEPQARLFYEVYRDRAAFEAHEAQPHTQRFLAERERYVAGFDVTFTTLLIAKGVVDPDQTT